MNIKRVVMLTTTFPYGIGENFIEPEIDSLPIDVDLDIAPLQLDKSRECRVLPKGVKVNSACTISSECMVRMRYTLKAIFSKCFFRECKNRFPQSLESIKMVIGYLGRAIEVSEKLERCYAKEIEEKTVTFYSYWLLEGAYAIGRLKAKYGNAIIGVSRAHGVDVYDDRSVYGVVPGREYTLMHLDRVYVCSQEGTTYLANKYSKYSEKFSCGYLGTKDYPHSEYGNSGEFIIVSCARLVELKRVHLLAEALALITDVKIHWFHLGDGPERSRVEKKIQYLPSNITVTLLGNTKHSDVMKFYQENRVNLFVNTSTTEGLPVSIMEAISFGIPVIATDVGGTSEIVNGETGVLISPEFDVKELAAHIKQYIYMDAHEYVSARKRTRRYWEETFSASRNYSEFYRQITDEVR